MKTSDEIESKIDELSTEIDTLLEQQYNAMSPLSCMNLQGIINTKEHRKMELKWVLNEKTD